MKTTMRGMAIDTNLPHIDMIRLHLIALRGMVIDTILLHITKIGSLIGWIGSPQISIEAGSSVDFLGPTDLTLSGSQVPKTHG